MRGMVPWRGMGWVQVAEALRARVRTELHFTCSCGVAANKTLAKVRAPAASGWRWCQDQTCRCHLYMFS